MKASLKSINITPPVGMQMAGYSERDHGAEGIHDELYAKVLVVDDGKRKVALVICDVIGIDLYVSENVRKIVSNKTDISKDAIMVSAIHTHSSVYACRLHGVDFLHTRQQDKESDEAYYQQLIQKIANGIIWANDNLQEAKIGFGKGNVIDLGTNRNDVHAYYDDSVNIIKVSNLRDEVLGIIVNHACHPTVLNQDNYLFSADYPAYFRSKLEALYPEAVVAFSQGAAGSASARYTKKASTFEEAKRLGEKLADATLQILDNIEMKETIQVSYQCENLVLKVKDFPSNEECISKIKAYEQTWQELIDTHANDQDIRKAYVTLQGAQREYQTRQNIHVKEIETMMQILNFDVCTIISIPGDVFGEIGRDIKLLDNYNDIVVVGYTNDFIGYILSKEGFEMNCYEKNMTIFDETSHDRILQVAKKLYSKETVRNN